MSNDMYPDSVRMVDAWLGALQRCQPYNDADTYIQTQCVRIWHQDGFSPGYFKTDDDQWVFVPDYVESP